MIFFLISFLAVVLNASFAQSDVTHYQWPNPPFNVSKSLTATFGEFRNTGSSDHFHNAVDIGEPDNNPVYPCINGTVSNKVSDGYNSYINVKSIINGKKKHLTYYHVVPNPALFINQVVTVGKTIIGTIYNGAAHIHLIERELLDANLNNIGNAINPVRREGGLNPYYDSYPPEIVGSTLKFYKDNSSIQMPSNQLKGKVDIRIKVIERNGATSSSTNNGTYILGFRILSKNGDSVIYEPKDDGVKYRFYNLPSDTYVHKVFVKGVATLSNPMYWLTNGYGEKQINNDLTIPNNYLDLDLLDEGSYQLEIFSEDTRMNTTSKRFPISVIKLPPELNTVIVNKDSISFSWQQYKSNKLKGYRIYYSNVADEEWKFVADESILNSNIQKISFNTPASFLEPTSASWLKYYITAIDSNDRESQRSDIYTSFFKSSNQYSVLIVDGFDRFGGTGSWSEPNHLFNVTYSSAINNNTGQSFNISSCSNEAIINEQVNLNDYDMVIWFLGDESIENNTLENTEQYKLAQYLESGGKLFITGDDIGQDLDTKHSYNESSDTLFYHQYLKAKLEHDGLGLLFEVNGEATSIFDGIHVTFGEVYPSDAPDDIEPINGAVPILNYIYMRDDSTYRKGGIAYTGTFRDSVNIGGLVYLSFPFETISSQESRNELMYLIKSYFGFNLVDVDKNNNALISFELGQNYPNPFNPVTTIKYSIPYVETRHTLFIQLKVYDILGRKVKTLVNEIKKPGNYKVQFDASFLTSGVYFYTIKTANFYQTKKMLLLK